MKPETSVAGSGAPTPACKDRPPVNKRPYHDQEGQLLPLLITPGENGPDLAEWMQGAGDEFRNDLTRFGGVLFRGFNIRSVEDFNRFMKCFNTEPLPYMFRSSPREEADKSIKNIYLSTSYPNKRSIKLHNESSYSRVWAGKIVFCCIRTAEEGGETPIADGRKVLNDISPALIAKFRAKGVMYRRNLIPDLGMPWQEVFQTNDLSEAEAFCKRNNITFKFIEKDYIVIEWVKPAIYPHPVSGEETWFNHVMFFNKFSRYDELGLPPDYVLPDKFLASHTLFGDGSEISFEEYNDIVKAYRKNIIAIPYQQGDIIFLDNMLSAHGRNPFKGDRLIVTALIEANYDVDYKPEAF